MTASRFLMVLSVGALALAVTGCGEKPVVYKQGVYQGKPDSKPWDNAQFNGNQVEWEKAIKARTHGQNEYSRSVASAK